MTHRNQNHYDESQLELPKAVADDLAALYQMDLAVPAEVDDAIIDSARRQLTRRRIVRLWRWAGGAAAAAAIVLIILISELGPIGRVSSGPAALAQRQDIDGNGRVDIIDALALARHIAADDRPQGTWDVNADGLVTRADVDMIAMAAVSLERRAPQ